MKTLIKALCDSAFLDDGKKLNIIGVFDNINAPQFPVRHPKMSCVLSLEDGKPNEKVDYYFSVENSRGETLVNMNEKKAQAQIGNNGRLNLIFNIIDMAFKEEGTYKITLYVGDYKDYLSFEVKPLPQGRA